MCKNLFVNPIHDNNKIDKVCMNEYLCLTIKLINYRYPEKVPENIANLISTSDTQHLFQLVSILF